MLFAIVMLGLSPQTGPMPGMVHAAACPATPAPLPPDLAGWSRMTPLVAGAAPAKAAPLTIGTGVKATLLPTATLIYAAAPEKPGAPGTSGGLFAVQIATAGRYRVALGAAAWIDMVQDGKPITSVAHAHGPACSPVRKMVDFDLRPGRYLLQVAGAPASTLGLLVAKLR